MDAIKMFLRNIFEIGIKSLLELGLEESFIPMGITPSFTFHDSSCSYGFLNLLMIHVIPKCF